MKWDGDALLMLDQRLLPMQTEWLRLTAWQEVEEAIREMAVRGAPAIGIAAGYGMALAALRGDNQEAARTGLAASRPTAVNLFLAPDRVAEVPFEFESVLRVAQRVEADDLACNHAIGRNGANLVPQGATILTICNTGALATAGHGTALGIIRTAHEDGKGVFVYSCETRPRQQGLRLTAYELLHEGIPFKSIVDSAAASLMQAGKIDLVVAGADRITANGDSANKIGTLSLAVLAHHFGVPFVIAAPTSTIDGDMASGDLIPIEERSAEEITHCEGVQIGPSGVQVYNPGFDVTPGDLISAIVTERGVFQKPYDFALEMSR